MDDKQLRSAIIEAYNDGYDNQPAVHYSSFKDRYDLDERPSVPEADAIADALDLGVRHARTGMNRLDDDELLEEMASWNQ